MRVLKIALVISFYIASVFTAVYYSNQIKQALYLIGPFYTAEEQLSEALDKLEFYRSEINALNDDIRLNKEACDRDYFQLLNSMK